MKAFHHRLGTEQLFKVSNMSRLVERQKMQIQALVVKKIVSV